MNIDIDQVRELIALAKEADISELTISNETGRITIKKRLAPESAAVSPSTSERIRAAASELPEAPALGGRESGERDDLPSKFIAIRSPVVGTVRLGEKPEGEPLVRAGQRVREGQVVCVVEAMKVLNEVTAPADGVIAQILVDNDQPVEYGQELMILEKEEMP